MTKLTANAKPSTSQLQRAWFERYQIASALLVRK
jgi:hypothetical protein